MMRVLAHCQVIRRRSEEKVQGQTRSIGGHGRGKRRFIVIEEIIRRPL